MPIDRSLAFSLDLARLDAYTRAQVLSLLKQLEKDLIARMGDMTAWGKLRAKQQLADAAKIIAQEYSKTSDAMSVTTSQVYAISAHEANKTLAISSMDGRVSLLPTEEVMKALARDSLIVGAPQKDWWSKQSLDTAFRFASAIRRGLVAAETNAQIIKRIRAELEVSRTNAAALVQTSVQTVANNARLATFQANSDVISGLRWLSTLDSHTCELCAPRDGMTWKMDHSKLKAELPFVNPPLHYNCRCVLVPITRFSNRPGSQRASEDGPVDSKITFEDFLKRKGSDFQNEVLGKGRANLWRAGKITLLDLVSGNGSPMTLTQLRAKYHG